jgi:hypothetical protein
MTAARKVAPSLAQAFDEARFGPARTLDLRTSMPTAVEATRRAEPWLRERQMARAGEVLLITGRGHGSPGGIGVVRRAIEGLLTRLRRIGVVARVRIHTPGAFVVELAPIRSLFETKPRARQREIEAVPVDPTGLDALDAETRRELRLLAGYSLTRLGVQPTETFVRDEMLRQFAILASGIASDEGDREGRLKFLVSAARAAFEDDA